MDAPPGTKNALKRRRLDEETQPRTQQVGSPAWTPSYPESYGFHRGLTDPQQSRAALVSQWASTTQQPYVRPTGGDSSAMLSHANPWNPYHNFPSQGATGSLTHGNSYQVAAANPQQPSTTFAVSSFDLRPSHTVPPEPAQSYTQILPASFCQQYPPAAAAHVPFGSQSWQGVGLVCVETQFPHLVLNNNMPTTSVLIQETTEEEDTEKVCFGMVS